MVAAQYVVHARKMDWSRSRVRILQRDGRRGPGRGSARRCGNESPTLTEADMFYSRNRVELYTGLEPDAPVVAVLDFDTRASILETHPQFCQGAHGRWPRRLDARGHCCLTVTCGRALRELTNQTTTLPGQGLYRAHDTLNVHTQPYRLGTDVLPTGKGRGL